MTATYSADLEPGEWQFLAPLRNFHLLQTKQRKSIRLYFGDVANPPSVDTEDYIVTQDYNPAPMPLNSNLGYGVTSVLYAMPDTDEPASVVVVLSSRFLDEDEPIILPGSGQFADATVGQLIQHGFALTGGIDLAAVTFAVTAGSLPLGTALNQLIGGPAIFGVPTTAGTYAFEITATWPAGVYSDRYVYADPSIAGTAYAAGSAKAVYSLTVKAA